MKHVIIFGLENLAELAHYYFENDTNHKVAAFSVNKEFLNSSTFKDLPVVEFETIEDHYPPSEYLFFAPMNATKMNKNREKIYKEIKDKGYQFTSYISSKATVLTDKIGDNCFIFEDNTIQPFTEIGNNVILWSGNHIGHHSIIKDHVFFTSHVVLSGNCIVESYCYLGVNASTKENITLKEGTFVAMNTAITKSTEPYGVYKGSDSKKINMSSLKIRF
jgi:sugar O-acyltransferase (sialic acid O-acetyltransferase NeuD family)